jgi:signal peptidase I
MQNQNLIKSQNIPTKKDQKSSDFFRKLVSFVFEVAKIVIISLAIIFPVRYFLIQPFYVKGSSMEPNFQDGEYLIINEISYRFSKPKRGDVIVFKYPKDTSQYYIKRIIGMPGETVEINNSRIIIYNEKFPKGIEINESGYLGFSLITSGEERVTLASDQYFVLGDNRVASSDSRDWGELPEKDIVGRAWLRCWPFDKIEVLGTPVYQLIGN